MCLQNALSGTTRAPIDDIQSYSSSQYEEAKEHLDRKYGTDEGERSCLIETLHRFDVINGENDTKIENMNLVIEQYQYDDLILAGIPRDIKTRIEYFFTLVKSK